MASFDIGTTAAKGVLVAKDGSIQGEVTVPIDTHYGDAGEVEQSPEQWWQSVVSICRTWWENGYSPDSVAMLSFSGQMQDCIPIDHEGQPVRPAILYSDGRAAKQADNIKERFPEEQIRRWTGNHLDGLMPLPKLLWLKESEPEQYARTQVVLISSKDYVIRKLTGACVTDPTSAATTGMMDISRREWLTGMVEECGVRCDLLPQLLAADEIAGQVTDEAAAATGFIAGTPVLCGVGDAGATTVGAGVTEVGSMYVYLGTTGWVAMPSETVAEQGNGIFHLAHLPEKLVFAVAPLSNAGNAHGWAARVFADEVQSDQANAFGQLERLMKESGPSAQDVYFLPYLHGERCPVQDLDASGCYLGVRPTTTRGQMARAVLEGVAMSIRQVRDLLADGRSVEQMTLIGGGSRSAVWNQLLADVCDARVVVPEQAEFLPSLGSAAAAFVRLGWADSYTHFSETYLNRQRVAVYSPNPEHRTIYQQRYQTFLQLYPTLQPLFSRL
ncbi:hypothetical protein LOK74_17305 [Brevibacillus humidisoli]|uniref:xylulokinase n=1 Tax=Brevibacillus humidisoli TaxID=2895522 RepID=UPI001E2F78C7|nr:FGGY family carbohydrate kinase [Brevibacillus humidisoli]UFJ43360.1 hypothetical protein LOK74_17305 [Brevibacillus humidisoli]